MYTGAPRSRSCPGGVDQPESRKDDAADSLHAATAAALLTGLMLIKP